jgi:GntR family transcriptional regulator
MRSGHEPAYRRIAAHFRADVEAGRLQPGERLPSENELMERFTVSRITVRNAIAVLAAEGVVETRHGSGTFVRHPPMPYQLYRLSSFAEVMRERGLQPSSRVLSLKVAAPPPEVARLLPPGEAHRLERLRLVNGEPLCHDETWLPPGIGERMGTAILESRTLYDVYEGQLGLHVVGASHAVEAVAASSGLARLLDVARGAPLLVVERVTHGEHGLVLDWQRRSYRADRFRLELELLRHPSQGAASASSSPVADPPTASAGRALW